MPQRKNMQVFIEPLLREASLKSIKPLHHLTCQFMESSKDLRLISVVPMACLSHMFVYGVVNISYVICSIKLLSYVYTQVTTVLKKYLH